MSDPLQINITNIQIYNCCAYAHQNPPRTEEPVAAPSQANPPALDESTILLDTVREAAILASIILSAPCPEEELSFQSFNPNYLLYVAQTEPCVALAPALTYNETELAKNICQLAVKLDQIAWIKKFTPIEIPGVIVELYQRCFSTYLQHWQSNASLPQDKRYSIFESMHTFARYNRCKPRLPALATSPENAQENFQWFIDNNSLKEEAVINRSHFLLNGFHALLKTLSHPLMMDYAARQPAEVAAMLNVLWKNCWDDAINLAKTAFTLPMQMPVRQIATPGAGQQQVAIQSASGSQQKRRLEFEKGQDTKRRR